MNKVFRTTGIIVLVLLLSMTTFANEKWRTIFSEDAMTGAIIWGAVSPKVGSLKQMSFPYGDTNVYLVVASNGEREWAYFQFNGSPNLSNTQTRNGYDDIRTRIKWDDDLEYIALSQSWGSSILNILDSEKAISQIASSSVVLLELDWYGEGKVHFSIPLTGSFDALKTVRSKFE